MDSNRRPNILELYKRMFISISKNIPLFLLIGILLKLFLDEIKSSPKLDIFNNPNILLIISGIGIALFSFFFKYLESGKSESKYSDELLYDSSDIKQILRSTTRSITFEKDVLEELKSLKTKIDENDSKTLDLNAEDKKKLFDLLEIKLEKNLSEGFLESIQQKFGADILATQQYSDLLRDVTLFKDRLNFEIRKLSLRANTNLSIGSVTTLIAVVVLYLTVVTNHVNFSDGVSMTSYFVPRISLVVFIEVFAFFFLKLYRSNLDNIRYYHNELTNIEMKIIALKSSIINGDKTTINDVVKTLSKTERNFIIKKGETTIELEQMRNENNNNQSILDFAKSVIAKKNTKKEVS